MIAALHRRGHRVAPFKVGPDFIDPGHHSRIAGRTSRNLDGWMLSEAYNLDCFSTHTRDADIVVIEGVMGLYDGYDGRSEAGSTAQMAKWLGLPILLVVDAQSMARSAAAVILGFEQFDPELTFAGIIFNKIGSKRHLNYLVDALEGHTGIRCLGGLVNDDVVSIPERHLGLVTREDHCAGEAAADHLANMIEENIDLDTLIAELPMIKASSGNRPPLAGEGPAKTVRIAVARDNAFCFYYQDNLDLLEQHGAELVFFSPIAGDDLPGGVGGLYLGGGYPELFGDKLADNSQLRHRIKAKSMDGMPIYGECGGFMYMCTKLFDLRGNGYPMTGCFPFSTRMHSRLKALGYRKITLTQDTVIGKQGMIIRGHEFHYSELASLLSEREHVNVYQISDRSGLDKPPDGFSVRNTLGSYNHLHFGSQPDAAGHFVKNCLAYRHQKEKQR